MTEPLRIVLAVGHLAARDALRALLGAAPGLVVVEQAATITAVVSRCQALRPAVLLLDLELAGAQLALLLAEVQAACPTTRVLALAGDPEYTRPPTVQALTRWGVAGVVHRAAPPEELRAAVQAIARAGCEGAIGGPPPACTRAEASRRRRGWTGASTARSQVGSTGSWKGRPRSG